MGQSIDYKRLGFGDIASCLRSLNEACSVIDQNGETFVFAVANKDTAHIEKMVSTQSYFRHCKGHCCLATNVWVSGTSWVVSDLWAKRAPSLSKMAKRLSLQWPIKTPRISRKWCVLFSYLDLVKVTAASQQMSGFRGRHELSPIPERRVLRHRAKWGNICLCCGQ